MEHKTVLLDEAVDTLAIKPNYTIVDCTLGAGGHAKRIIEQLDSAGTLIACDVDETAIQAAQEWVGTVTPSIVLCNENFSTIRSIVDTHTDGSVHGILADLGWHTDQFTKSGKGFSFQRNEPLIMTYGDPALYSTTAGTIVNEWDESDIANVIYGYGEDRFARSIAAAIVSNREESPIDTTDKLAAIVSEAVPARYRKHRIHPATKTFQALRIAVNDELSILESFIHTAFECLHPNGRLAIISFHSLEDRIVKHTFRDIVTSGNGELVHKKPIIPTRDEVVANPRARSAKLRTITRL